MIPSVCRGWFPDEAVICVVVFAKQKLGNCTHSA
jgi:hypothetical protein